MVDRRRPPTRTPPTRSSRTFKTRARPEREKSFSPVRGDLMDRANNALRGARDSMASRTPPSGGRSAGGGPGQGAIDFGRSMTGGGDDAIQRVKDEILNNVMERLGEKGIYRDGGGSFQIRGLERGGDPGLAIRDSAVASMGGPDWTKIVSGARGGVLGSPGGGVPGGPVKTTTSVGGVEPMTMADRIIAETQKKIAARQAGLTPPRPQISTPSGTPTIPGRKTTTSVGGVEPGLPPRGGVYPDKDVPYPGPPKVDPRLGTVVTGAGMGGSLTPPKTTFPKEMAQGTPGSVYMGPEAQARQQQQTVFNASPGLGGNVFTPKEQQQVPGSTPITTPGVVGNNKIPTDARGYPVMQRDNADYTGTIVPYSGPPAVVVRNGETIWTPDGGGGAMAPGLGGAPSQGSNFRTFGGQAMGFNPPPQAAPSGYGGSSVPAMNNPYQPQPQPQPQINTTPVAAPQGQQQAPQPIPATVYPPGQGQVTPNPNAAGPSATRQGTAPLVPTGGTAGPTQAAPVQPTKTPGPAIPAPGPNKNVPMPGQPGAPPLRPGQMPTRFPNGQPFGGPNPNVDAIQAQAQQRIAQQMGGRMPGGGQVAPGMANLAGLGERISQQVRGSIGGMQRPSQVAAPGGTFGGDIDSIMSRVQQQLAQSRIPGGRPDMGMPGQPMPGGTTPGGVTPGRPTTGTGGTLGSYGNQSIDQWDQAFIAAGNKYGVDPTLLKAMMDIESGGNGNLPLDQCRSDGSCGPMQVKPGIWGSVGSVPEQIEQAAKILGDGVSSGQYPNAEAALFGIYFPTDDVMNGTTQGGYAERVHQLQAQMGPYEPGTGQTMGGTGTAQYGYPNATELSQRMAQNPYSPGGGVPTGTIQTTQWGNGASWDTMAQYDATIQAEAAKHGIDPAYLYASMAIESGGADVCNPDGIHCHVLQMDPANSADAARLGYDISTNEGQIGYLAAIAEGTAGIGTGNTPEERIMSVYPGAGGSAQHVAEYSRDWESIVQQYGAAGGGAAAPQQPGTTMDVGQPGQNLQQMGVTNPDGTLTDQALQALGINEGAVVRPGQLTQEELQAIGAGAGATHDPSGGIPGHIDPNTQQFVPDVAPTGPGAETPGVPPVASGTLDIVYTPSSNISKAADGSDESYMVDQSGGYYDPNMISSEFGGPVLEPAWYVYQEGMGGSRYEHDAYDIAYPRGTPISATDFLQGTVSCVVCDGSYGTGYVENGVLIPDYVGVGRIDVALDPSLHGGQQITMVYGHMLGSNVEAGQQVTTGTQIGTSGYAGTGDHLHEEARASCPGYTNPVTGGPYDNDQRLIDPTLVADGFYQTHNACTDEPL